MSKVCAVAQASRLAIVARPSGLQFGESEDSTLDPPSQRLDDTPPQVGRLGPLTAEFSQTNPPGGCQKPECEIL